MSRRRRTRSRRRDSSKPQEERHESSSPRLLSRDEKRGLILAHAEARRPLKPRDRMTLWGGVAICALFILGAWATTVRSGIDRLWAGSDSEEFSEVINAGKALTAEIKEATEEGKTGLQMELERVQRELEKEASKEGVREALMLQLTSPPSAEATGDGSATSTSPDAEALGDEAEEIIEPTTLEETE